MSGSGCLQGSRGSASSSSNDFTVTVENDQGQTNQGFERSTAAAGSNGVPPTLSEPSRISDVPKRKFSLGELSSGGPVGPPPPMLVFRDVGVTIGKKVILTKICGLARVGQTLAVMGPSGAGKSTLLNTLGGRVPASSGTITLSGVPVRRTMRRSISYVPQEDVFYPNLTLRETLTFTALLRLPNRMPRAQKLKRIQEVVDALELNKCLETRIGGTFVTGLSGGEKKRASIACELLTNPKILILDEPTSGLDSAIAYSLMSTLNKYVSQSHKTVVTTIHQPSSQIFYMFHNVLLIADGEVAYFGEGCEILDFFSRVGFQCATHYNPADFILERVKSSPDNLKKILEGAYALRTQDSWPLELRESESGVKPTIQGNKERRRNSVGPVLELAKRADGYRSTLDGTEEVDVERYVVEGVKWQTSFLTQYVTLTRRNFHQQRDRFLSKLGVCQILFIAVLAGLEWFQTPREESRARDRVGTLFFVIVQFGFITMGEGVVRIYDASGVFLRERSSGVWRLSAFYLAVMTSEVPATMIMITGYSCIIYWMAGLTATPGNFFSFIGVLMLSAFAAQSIGLFVGTVILNKTLVGSIANTIMIASLLVGGFYNTGVAYWFSWIRYLSFLSYGLSAMGHIEFSGGPNFTCAPVNETTFPQYCGDDNAPKGIPGSALLVTENLDFLPLYANILILISLIVFFRVAGYIALRLTRPKT